MKPTVLVTGASGFVATRVVQRLLTLGYKVRGTVRSLENTDKVAPLKSLFPALELFEADLLSGEDAFVKAMEGCRYVIHTASPFKLNVSDPVKELVEPAVKGTEAVFKAAAKAKVAKIVVTSSVAAIGPGMAWFEDAAADREKVFTEEDWNTTDEPVDGGRGYRHSKTKAEQKAWELGKELGIDVAVINPSFVIGPPLSSRTDGESVNFIKGMLDGTFKEKAAKGELKGIRLCVVDVRDVAAAHVAAMEKDAADGKRFIVSSERAMSRAEFAGLLKDRFKAYPLPTESQEPDVVQKYTNSRAKEVLGFKPRPIEVSLRDMANAAIQLGITAQKFVLKKVKFGKVSDVVPDSRGVDLLVSVVSKEAVEEGKGGSNFDVVVGDSSAIVKLRLSSEEAKEAEVGSVIEVRNASVKMIKGFVRLTVGKFGKLKKHEGDTTIEVNKARDVSATEYELVMA